MKKLITEMTIQEAEEFVVICEKTKRLPKSEQITKEEIFVELKKKRTSLRIDVSMRCYEGYFIIDALGNVSLYDESGKLEPLENQIETANWLQERFVFNQGKKVERSVATEADQSSTAGNIK